MIQVKNFEDYDMEIVFLNRILVIFDENSHKSVEKREKKKRKRLRLPLEK